METQVTLAQTAPRCNRIIDDQTRCLSRISRRLVILLSPRHGRSLRAMQLTVYGRVYVETREREPDTRARAITVGVPCKSQQ
jgi:hypothetical protein